MTTNEIKYHKPFGDVIAGYSRAQAIEDGFLIDVTRTSWEAGISFPDRPDGYRLATLRHRARKGLLARRKRPTLGRSHHAPRCHHSRHGRPASRFQRGSPKRHTPPHDGTDLMGVCSPGDNGRPVITIMMTDED